ncbi:hypothetical protein [Ramlibacter albus]|uniref:Uncharacterized protein n=1 Tax=Ramlibacter albus TaxID=2079448 RepID=A0A923S1H7_9BURK|nr:hypothetical protein [Ramlibacter albus]MBC5764300.1 hypothetical protein [Ramlibacter albus]
MVPGKSTETRTTTTTTTHASAVYLQVPVASADEAPDPRIHVCTDPLPPRSPAAVAAAAELAEARELLKEIVAFEERYAREMAVASGGDREFDSKVLQHLDESQRDLLARGRRYQAPAAAAGPTHPPCEPEVVFHAPPLEAPAGEHPLGEPGRTGLTLGPRNGPEGAVEVRIDGVASGSIDGALADLLALLTVKHVTHDELAHWAEDRGEDVSGLRRRLEEALAGLKLPVCLDGHDHPAEFIYRLTRIHPAAFPPGILAIILNYVDLAGHYHLYTEGWARETISAGLWVSLRLALHSPELRKADQAWMDAVKAFEVPADEHKASGPGRCESDRDCDVQNKLKTFLAASTVLGAAKDKRRAMVAQALCNLGAERERQSGNTNHTYSHGKATGRSSSLTPPGVHPLLVQVHHHTHVEEDYPEMKTVAHLGPARFEYPFVDASGACVHKHVFNDDAPEGGPASFSPGPGTSCATVVYGKGWSLGPLDDSKGQVEVRVHGVLKGTMAPVLADLLALMNTNGAVTASTACAWAAHRQEEPASILAALGSRMEELGMPQRLQRRRMDGGQYWAVVDCEP